MKETMNQEQPVKIQKLLNDWSKLLSELSSLEKKKDFKLVDDAKLKETLTFLNKQKEDEKDIKETPSTASKKDTSNPNIYVPVLPHGDNCLPENHFSFQARQLYAFLKLNYNELLYETSGYLLPSNNGPFIDLMLNIFQSYSIDPFKDLPIRINADIQDPEVIFTQIGKIIDDLYHRIFNGEDNIFQNQLAWSYMYQYYFNQVQIFFNGDKKEEKPANQYYQTELLKIKQSVIGKKNANESTNSLDIAKDAMVYPMQRISRIVLLLVELINKLIELNEVFTDKTMHDELQNYIEQLKNMSFTEKQSTEHLQNAQKRLINFYQNKLSTLLNTLSDTHRYLQDFSKETELKKAIDKLNACIEKVSNYLDVYRELEGCLKEIKLVIKSDTIQIAHKQFDENTEKLDQFLQKRKPASLLLRLNFENLSNIYHLLNTFVQMSDQYKPIYPDMPYDLESDILSIKTLIKEKVISLQQIRAQKALESVKESRNSGAYKYQPDPVLFKHANDKPVSLSSINDMDNFDKKDESLLLTDQEIDNLTYQNPPDIFAQQLNSDSQTTNATHDPQ